MALFFYNSFQEGINLKTKHLESKKQLMLIISDH